MRILVTRPEPDAKLQAERLMELGHETLLAPLLRIEFLPHVPLELDDVDALIVTSRNALRALEAHPQRGEALQHPLYAVGDATAELARALGFSDIAAGPGTGEALAKLINAGSQKGASFLHLSGETVAFDLKAALDTEGFDVRQPILY